MARENVWSNPGGTPGMPIVKIERVEHGEFEIVIQNLRLPEPDGRTVVAKSVLDLQTGDEVANVGVVARFFSPEDAATIGVATAKDETFVYHRTDELWVLRG